MPKEWPARVGGTWVVVAAAIFGGCDANAIDRAVVDVDGAQARDALDDRSVASDADDDSPVDADSTPPVDASRDAGELAVTCDGVLYCPCGDDVEDYAVCCGPGFERPEEAWECQAATGGLWRHWRHTHIPCDEYLSLARCSWWQ